MQAIKGWQTEKERAAFGLRGNASLKMVDGAQTPQTIYRSGLPIETKLFTWKYNIIWKINLEMWRESSAQLC